MELTKEQIKQLRAAETLVFRYIAEEGAQIEAKVYKRVRHGGESKKVSFEYDIPAVASVSTFTGQGSEKPTSICFVEMFADSTLSGFTHFLRPGDSIRLEFLVQNNSDLLDRKGLYNDELRIAVLRGPRRYFFRACQEVCENNSARAVRYGGGF